MKVFKHFLETKTLLTTLEKAFLVCFSRISETQIGKFAECAEDLSFVRIACAAVFVSLNNSSIVSFCCFTKISRLEPRLKFKVRGGEIGRARQTFQSGQRPLLDRPGWKVCQLRTECQEETDKILRTKIENEHTKIKIETARDGPILTFYDKPWNSYALRTNLFTFAHQSFEVPLKFFGAQYELSNLVDRSV